MMSLDCDELKSVSFCYMADLELFLVLAVQVAPGSLPKGLHSLDLSRNKIATIEGLRELTKLRVLNLSYNRISRIGHGKQATCMSWHFS